MKKKQSNIIICHRYLEINIQYYKQSNISTQIKQASYFHKSQRLYELTKAGTMRDRD